MGPLGWQETMVIFVLALLIFGPKKLPELGKNIGKAITEFRRASSELKSTWDREMAAMEREAEPIKQATQELDNHVYNSYSDSGYYDSDPYGDPYNAAGQIESNPSTVSASATQGAESTEAAGNGEPAVAASTATAETPNPAEAPAKVAGQPADQAAADLKTAQA
jgi:TatA/E family protein of Tat protein translocase